MKQSPELQLIFCVLQSAEKSKLIIIPGINWDLVYALAIRHRVWQQLYHALTPINVESPIPIYEKLAQYCRHSQMRILAISAETVRVATEFTARTIQHCFVKGIVLNVHIYESLEKRPCKDIDVWVDTSDYQRAVEVLLALGYQIELPFELKGFQKQYYMRHLYDVAFYHPDKKIQIELHFRLHQFGVTLPSPDPTITQTVMLFNTPIQTLKDDYHLLYLMIHGAVHAWTRLRWLNDIALYIKSGKCNLERVMLLGKELHCEHIVEQSLILIQNNFGMQNPCLSQLIKNPSRRGMTIARDAQEFIGADFELTPKYSIYNKMFIKYRLYLARLTPSGQKMRVIMRNFFKIEYLFQYVTFSARFSFIYYFLYPLWVIKVMISR